MPVSPDLFRLALGHLAGGVAVVTARKPGGAPRGLTATAVCSVSLEPPLVLACIGRDASTHEAVEASGAFGINLLDAGHRELAERFAWADEDKFRGVAHETGATGSPLLVEALVACDCRVEETVEAGDHTIFVGRVEQIRLAEAAEPVPLVHYRGRYGTVAVLPGAS